MFAREMERSKKAFREHRDDLSDRVKELRASAAEAEKTMSGLLDSLGSAGSESVRQRVMQKIRELDGEIQNKMGKIKELETAAARQALSQEEFARLRDTVTDFAATVDRMSVGQRREAVKALARTVLWDGESAHVLLLGTGPEEARLCEDSK